MVNVSESSYSSSVVSEPKKLIGSSQNGMRWTLSDIGEEHGQEAHGVKTKPNPIMLQTRNEVSPTSPLQATGARQTARNADGGAGRGWIKKRMPPCNGTDRV